MWRETFDFQNQDEAIAAHKADHNALHPILNDLGLVQGVPTDGTTDALAAIQAHLDATGAAWLPAGNIRLSAPIRVTAAAFRWLRGMGAKLTILKPDAGVNAVEIENAAGYIYDGLMCDFSVVGGARGIASIATDYQLLNWQFDRLAFSGQSVAGMELLNGFYNGTFRNVRTSGGQYGIYAATNTGINGNTFLQCECDGASIAGLHLSAGAQNNVEAIQVIGGIFQNNAVAISLEDVSHVTVMKPYFEGNTVVDMKIVGTDAPKGCWNIDIFDGYHQASTLALKIEGRVYGLNVWNFAGRNAGIQWNEDAVQFADDGRRHITSLATVTVNDAGVVQP